MSTSTKRPRTQSSSRSSSNSSTTATSPPSKSSRTVPNSQISDSDSTLPESRPLFCSLPPTCHHRHTPIAHSRDLEAHYAKYHAHVCEENGCGCVFPDERLLDLHQTECHDTLATIRKERGEKIFACHLATCPKTFATPKTRRLHLIQAHGYPKEYFFAVTNKGIGGLLKKWGDGASLIRGQWKARETVIKQEGRTASNNPRNRSTEDDSDDSDTQSGDATESEDMDVDARDHHDQADATPKAIAKSTKPLEDDAVDAIASEMSALSLIPSSVRFGRGGKTNGFAHAHNNNRPTNGYTNVNDNNPSADPSSHGQARQHQHSSHVDGQDAMHPRGRGRGRGRGARGAGPVTQPILNGNSTMAIDKPEVAPPVMHAANAPAMQSRGVPANLRGRGRGRGRVRAH